jgi:hypothetical protein
MISKLVGREFADNHPCVSWRGESFSAGNELSSFLQSQVRSRLDDEEGTDAFHNHLRGLELTGMGKANLEAVLNAEESENRDWAAGEALAEAYLIESESFIFPWNMERDKRNPFGSLPGADLVGFVAEGTGFRLALGEVKTSSEKNYPPQVMSGRSGHMGHQIDALASNLTTICHLIKWLHPRTRGGNYQQAFDLSCISYFNSGTKAVALFGVLIRDTIPNKLDLSVRGNALRQKLAQPTLCNLIALYLPWNTEHLTTNIRLGGDL